MPLLLVLFANSIKVGGGFVHRIWQARLAKVFPCSHPWNWRDWRCRRRRGKFASGAETWIGKTWGIFFLGGVVISQLLQVHSGTKENSHFALWDLDMI